MKSLLLVALLGCLSAAFAQNKVKWCVTSAVEERKCTDLVNAGHNFLCVQKSSITDCLTAIQAKEADAITLDGGEIHEAGLSDYQLHPIIAEVYGNETCYYAVAVAKKDTQFGLHDLRQKKSCHTGLGKSAGWNIPIGTLLSKDILQWQGRDSKELQDAVSEFFNSSCVPNAKANSNLCALCKDCSSTSSNPYYNYDGAFRCLKEDLGVVAFVKHLTVPENERENYELLCENNKRARLADYKTCNLARVPSHAVVTRKDDTELADLIWTTLENVPKDQLFSSAKYQPSKNLMFKDSTTTLKRLPPNTDSFMYLGAKYMTIFNSLKSVTIPGTRNSTQVKWCVKGDSEAEKCGAWAAEGARIKCIRAETDEDCINKILHREADAVTLDGGKVYTAGKCGLVPVMGEQYDLTKCGTPSAEGSFYYAVAVVKKNSGVTWKNLKSKKSCHTGIGRNAGWNIPMGRLFENSPTCDFGTFFTSSCAPGAAKDSTLCSMCIGNNDGSFKCSPSSDERYNSYAGAFRCLVETDADVAFVKHSTVEDNSDGRGPSWAANIKSEEYELICPNHDGPQPLNSFADCNLAKARAHAVVSHPEKGSDIVKFLKEQQGMHGNNQDPLSFNMFKSKADSDLLFKDATKCLQEIKESTVDLYLGDEYMKAMSVLRKCAATRSALEDSCSFHYCSS